MRWVSHEEGNRNQPRDRDTEVQSRGEEGISLVMEKKQGKIHRLRGTEAKRVNGRGEDTRIL